VTSDRHTVVVGYQDDWSQPELVLDILLFRKLSADQSLSFAKGEGWRFYRSLGRHSPGRSTTTRRVPRAPFNCWGCKSSSAGGAGSTGESGRVFEGAAAVDLRVQRCPATGER
jgi:hypothetical protein